MSGYLNKEKSSDLFSLLGSWNKRFFTFDGKQMCYYQDEDTMFLGPSATIHVKYETGTISHPKNAPIKTQNHIHTHTHSHAHTHSHTHTHFLTKTA